MGPCLGRDPKRVSNRRNFLIVVGALGVMAGWRAASPVVGDIFAGDFAFRNIDGLEGFRKIDDGAISSASLDPFLGIGDADKIPTMHLPGAAVLLSIYPPQDLRGPGVPVAEFTDYNCPYCKVLSERLHTLEAEGEIDLTLHHLPLLGAGSLDAARIALAVDDPAFHTRLMAARFRVDADYALQLARDQGRDVEAIKSKIGAHEHRLARSKAIADNFGIIGTPALVVGRTLVIGQISERRLRRLIEIERVGERERDNL